MEQNNKIVLFQEKQIRRVWDNDQWWFVIEDVVQILTDSSNPKGYIRDMRRRDTQLSEGWGQIAHTLSIETKGGKQKMNCSNTEGVFRILMSIPSPIDTRLKSIDIRKQLTEEWKGRGVKEDAKGFDEKRGVVK